MITRIIEKTDGLKTLTGIGLKLLILAINTFLPELPLKELLILLDKFSDELIRLGVYHKVVKAAKRRL